MTNPFSAIAALGVVPIIADIAKKARAAVERAAKIRGAAR
jgi:hypothetical protein